MYLLSIRFFLIYKNVEGLFNRVKTISRAIVFNSFHQGVFAYSRVRIDRGNAGIRCAATSDLRTGGWGILSMTRREANGMVRGVSPFCALGDDEKCVLPLRKRESRILYDHQPHGGPTTPKAIWGKKTGPFPRANTRMANSLFIVMFIGYHPFDIFDGLIPVEYNGIERDRYSCRVSSVMVEGSLNLYGSAASRRSACFCKRVEKDLHGYPLREECRKVEQLVN